LHIIPFTLYITEKDTRKITSLNRSINQYLPT